MKKTNKTEVEQLAESIEKTGGNGQVNEENQKILHLLATGQIDYEAAVNAIKRNFNKNDK